MGSPAPHRIHGDTRVFPCSQSQLRFWADEQRYPGHPALCIHGRWRLAGRVRYQLLEEAWRILIMRHDALRSAFPAADANGPLQSVVAAVPFSMRVVDLRSLPEIERSPAAERAAHNTMRTSFTIARAPLIAITLIILGDTENVLVVSAHKLVCDAASLEILAAEMTAVYASLESGTQALLPATRFDYGTFVARERETAKVPATQERCRDLSAALREATPFEIMPDRSRPRSLRCDGDYLSITIDRAAVSRVAAVARKARCTPAAACYTAFLILLGRFTGERDVTVGARVAGRAAFDAGNAVGCFEHIIGLRADLAGDPTFTGLLSRTQDILERSGGAARLTFAELAAIANPARDPSRGSLFAVNVAFQDRERDDLAAGSFRLTRLPFASLSTLCDLAFTVVASAGRWQVSCEYNTHLFDPGTVRGLLECFATVLDGVPGAAARPISSLAIMPAESRASLDEPNRTSVARPADQTLVTLFAEQAARTPNAVAVVCGSRTLTYERLRADVSALARRIASGGCSAGSRVGVLLDRSADMVVALLAVLESGCAYVPLDPSYPLERLAFITSDSDLRATITRSSLADLAGVLGGSSIFIDMPESGGGAEPQPLARSVRPDSVAYVIYTSGSTGKPKGVQIQHRSLLNFLLAMRDNPGLSAADTLVAVTSMSFDIAALELFLPLIVGARLVIATLAEIAFGRALLRLLQRAGATVMQATPVTWKMLVDAGWKGDGRMKILCGGEALSRPLAEALLDRSPNVWNMYGPTETTVWSSVMRVSRGCGPVPIGPPIANTQFYVLDAAGNLVPPGAPGELFIGGEGVAAGYLGRDALTAERFVPNRFAPGGSSRIYRTGDIVRWRGRALEFLGRSDSQIKLRGFRIELGEIASVLLREPHVAEATVVKVDDLEAGPSLCAYVVPVAGFRRAGYDWTAELQCALAKFLPKYMLPSAIVVLEQLPRTPNGKIDRAALPHASLAGYKAALGAPA